MTCNSIVAQVAKTSDLLNDRTSQRDRIIFSQNIRGKVVVITWAGSGLGAATARLLAFEGAVVVLAGVERITTNARRLS
jgi:hypothetical protein